MTSGGLAGVAALQHPLPTLHDLVETGDVLRQLGQGQPLQPQQVVVPEFHPTRGQAADRGPLAGQPDAQNAPDQQRKFEPPGLAGSPCQAGAGEPDNAAVMTPAKAGITAMDGRSQGAGRGYQKPERQQQPPRRLHRSWGGSAPLMPQPLQGAWQPLSLKQPQPSFPLMQPLFAASALLLTLPLMTPLSARAGGLEGRFDSRIVGNTSTENITNGYRNISLLRESRTNWSGESLTNQSTANMTFQLDGLLSSSLTRIEELQTGSLQSGTEDQASGTGKSLIRNLMQIENPVINLSTSTGSSQSRITATGSDYSWTNAHMVDSFNSSSTMNSYGSESSNFGQTF